MVFWHTLVYFARKEAQMLPSIKIQISALVAWSTFGKAIGNVVLGLSFSGVCSVKPVWTEY